MDRDANLKLPGPWFLSLRKVGRQLPPELPEGAPEGLEELEGRDHLVQSLLDLNLKHNKS